MGAQLVLGVVMITRNEILVQIALGVADTPHQIAKLVKTTTDITALEWALKYKNTKVRAAAVSNAALPIGLLLWACIFERSKTVQNILVKIVDTRCNEIEHALNIVKYYPQLSMDWNDAGTTSEHS